MTVSIIIAVKTWQKNLEECVGRCLELDYPDFEILVLPDNPIARDLGLMVNLPVKVIPTGEVGPALKRDMAVSFAQGEILAFIDDDAYPDRDWLKIAVQNFADPDVAAVGGPAITAPGDTLRQKASGLIYSSALVSAQYTYRYLPKARRQVDDYPSCNFLVRKSVMLEIGGFKTNFWPGEDTKLCLEITKRLGKRIIYDPRAIVYHHRRSLFLPHLRQVANYGLQRGYFVKKYPRAPFKLNFFVPALFVAAVISGLSFSLAWPPLRPVYGLSLLMYLLIVLIFSLRGAKSTTLRLVPLVFPGIILTHFTYGTYFIRGLFFRKVREENP